MAWISVPGPGEAAAELQRALETAGLARGRVDNILRVHSIHAAVLLAHLSLYQELMFGPSSLSRIEREIVAVAVSATNGCHY